MGVMASLLGGDVNFHSMKAVLKPPGHISAQGWCAMGGASGRASGRDCLNWMSCVPLAASAAS